MKRNRITDIEIYIKTGRQKECWIDKEGMIKKRFKRERERERERVRERKRERDTEID